MNKNDYFRWPMAMALPLLLIACAGDPEPRPEYAGSTGPGPGQPEVYQQDDQYYREIENRLQQLQRLYQQGLISDQDYQSRRREIISQL